MRKIILLILMLSFVIKVKALENTYYTDYGTYSDYQEQAVTSDEVTEVEEMRKYLYSRKIYSDGGYHPLGQVFEEYPLIDMNDYTFPAFTNWESTASEPREGRIIETKTTYHYQEALGIRYIHLYNLYGSYGAFRISEIDVLKSGVNMPYTISCTSCSDSFAYYANNNFVPENLSFIYNGGSLTIDLGTYYPLNTLDLKLYLFDMGDEAKRYSVAYTRVNDKTKPYIYQTYNSYFKHENVLEIVATSYNVNNMLIGNLEYGPIQIANDVVPETVLRKVTAVTEYRYYDPLYHYYNWIVEYAPDYQSEPTSEYPIIDQFHYKDYYRFRSRAKLVLNEPLLIEEKETLLANFILETSEDYVLESNLNYDVNGTYLIKFIYPTGTIEKEVVVNIVEEIIPEEVVIPEEVIPQPEEEISDTPIPPEPDKSQTKKDKETNQVIKPKPKPVIKEEIVYEKEEAKNDLTNDQNDLAFEKSTDDESSNNNEIFRIIRPMFIYLGIFITGLIVIVKKRFNF